jgi:hypothetical protein
MASSRLPFLYPNFVRSVRSCEPTTYRSLRLSTQSAGSHAGFHSGKRCEQEQYHQRYGPAAEPRLPPKSPKGPSLPQSTKGEEPPPQQSDRSAEKAQQDDASTQKKQNNDPTSDSKGKSPDSTAASVTSSHLASELPPQDTDNHDPRDTTEDPTAPSSKQSTGNSEAGNRQNPLETVFQMPPPPSGTQSDSALCPTTTNSDKFKPPHLTASPYVHHFDTYTLVRDLERGGFTEEQSVTIMKAIRALLAENLELAREGLISKSDTENETYLFLAACSELRTSLQTSRNSEIQHQRSQRAQLQHEVDILTQRMTQELSGLKDDLKGMFNDRKMSTKETQRSLDTAIQELNYQITVSLNSDGKSEVEGLRWILTRRAAMAIAISAGKAIPIYCSFYRSLAELRDNSGLSNPYEATIS